MNEKLEKEITDLHEKKSELKKEEEDLRVRKEIISITIFLRRKEFNKLRDLKISISSPRSESILEKVTEKMEEIEEEIKEASKKKEQILKDVDKNEKERQEVQAEIERMQQDYPEFHFYVLRM